MGIGQLKTAREIVPGDIISVGLGDIVPADAKIISGGISIDQSILTGESLTVSAQNIHHYQQYYNPSTEHLVVKAEMTATFATGIYRFTFPKSEQSHS